MQPPYYTTISDFFDYCSLSQARKLLNLIIKAAGADKIAKVRSPANLLYFIARMEELAEAVYTLMIHGDKKPGAVLDKKQKKELWSLTLHDAYCSSHIHSSPWHSFPRELTKKEFIDPYKALKKFTRYQTLQLWKDKLQDLLAHALSPNCIDQWEDGTEIIRVYIHLHKLIEAAHLIEVRTNEKNKMKDDN